MYKFNFCPMCGAAWDAWNDNATKCWQCGYEEEAKTAVADVLPEKCEDHPKYKGIGIPAVDCLTCWKLHKKIVIDKISTLT